MEWESNFWSNTRFCDGIRCEFDWLGSMSRKFGNRWCMVMRGEVRACKLPRIDGRFIRFAKLQGEDKGTHSSDKDGQCVCGDIYKQIGGGGEGGGVKSQNLAELAKDFWNFCLEHKV